MGAHILSSGRLWRNLLTVTLQQRSFNSRKELSLGRGDKQSKYI